MKPQREMNWVQKCAGYIPSLADYAAGINLHPTVYAHPPYGTDGEFRLSLALFSDRKEVARLESAPCREDGNIRMDISRMAREAGLPEDHSGMYVLDCHGPKDIPLQIYLNFAHKATGTYFASTGVYFMGEMNYEQAHSDEMENTLFWPGLADDAHNESNLVLMNPYPSRMDFQAHLMWRGQVAARSEAITIKARDYAVMPMSRLFPGALGSGPSDEYSLCLASQFKIVALLMTRNRATGIITHMDHMHAYCLPPTAPAAA